MDKDFPIFQKYFNNKLKQDDIIINTDESEFILQDSSFNPRTRYYKQPKPAKNKKTHPALLFLLAEGLFATNAWIASENPNLFGVVSMLLMAPMSMTGYKTKNWIAFGYFEALGYYNLTIDSEKKSKSTIFKENMIAWNLMFLTDYFIKDENPSQKESVYIMPTYDNGVKIVYNYKL